MDLVQILSRKNCLKLKSIPLLGQLQEFKYELPIRK